MKNMNKINGITFQSKIRPVNREQFNKIISTYEKHHFVDYPWTVKESVLSNKAYTKGVFDCTVCGITDRTKVLLLHICPTMKANQDFSSIINFIKRTFDIKSPNMQGFLLGSKNLPYVGEKSLKMFDNFEKFFEQHKIPFSKIKGGRYANDVAYSCHTDEWIISHEKLANYSSRSSYKNPANFIDMHYDEIKINELDEISW